MKINSALFTMVALTILVPHSSFAASEKITQPQHPAEHNVAHDTKHTAKATKTAHAAPDAGQHAKHIAHASQPTKAAPHEAKANAKTTTAPKAGGTVHEAKANAKTTATPKAAATAKAATPKPSTATVAAPKATTKTAHESHKQTNISTHVKAKPATKSVAHAQKQNHTLAHAAEKKSAAKTPSIKTPKISATPIETAPVAEEKTTSVDSAAQISAPSNTVATEQQTTLIETAAPANTLAQTNNAVATTTPPAAAEIQATEPVTQAKNTAVTPATKAKPADAAVPSKAASVTSQATTFNKPVEHLSERQDIAVFINQMVEQDHFDKKQLSQVFDKVQLRPEVVSRMEKPAEAKPWHYYQNFFITKDRIAGGVKFWSKHAEAIQRAEQEYGVPSQIIVAIIGVETEYGKHLGNFRVIDSLSTLAFNYPKRQTFFRKELREFLLLSRELDMDPLVLQGSYAGAIGAPQFMPSSYRHFAVDFAHHGKRDLVNEPVDAIGSVGNYLHANGWRKEGDVTAPLQVSKDYFDQHFKDSYQPYLALETLVNDRILEASGPTEDKTALLRFNQENHEEYWLGFYNFYVITRYNNSQNYAMAVFQLGQSIAEEYLKQTKSTTA